MRWENKIPVEVDGGFEWVSLTAQHCTCDFFKTHRMCDHLKYAIELFQGKGRGNRFVLFSALHKEIRRGAVDKVLSWAWIILQNTQPDSLKKYLTRIHFEESRAIRLWNKIVGGNVNLFEHIVEFTQVHKKWELSTLNPHIRNWHQGFVQFRNSGPITMLELGNRLSGVSNMNDVYEMYFQLKEQKQLRALASQILFKIGAEKNNGLLCALAVNCTKSYELMAALELTAGLHDMKADALKPIPKELNLFLPKPQIYYYDIHTWLGARNLKQNWDACLSNENFQLGSVDLRWSGMVLGSLFREKATQVPKPLTSVTWDEAKILSKDLNAAIDLDKYFYPKFFKQKRKG